MIHKGLVKFVSGNYVNDEKLLLDEEGNIYTVDNELRFCNLEFDSSVIINTLSLILSKYNTLNQDIYKFTGIYKNTHPYSIHFENIKSYTFSNCKFNDDVYFNLPDDCSLELEYCSFEKKLNINKDINPQQKTNRTIEINKLVINNCIFKSTFIFESCIVNSYRIIDVILEEDAKFFDIKFYTMFENTKEEEVAYFTNTTFHKSAIFEKVTFKEFIQFKYTFFKGYTLFRDVKFEEGLDIDYTNIENEINFSNLQGLDKQESKEKTSQETYRIIKYNFEKIGNKIEANKYHAIELEQKKNNLEKDIKNIDKEDEKIKKLTDYIVFQIHWISSEHSTNWFLSILWIVFVGLFTTVMLNEFNLLSILIFVSSIVLSFLIFKSKEFRLIVVMFGLLITIISVLDINFKEVIQNISLITLENITNINNTSWFKLLIILFNKVSLGYLYYQFLLSVRKDTRK